MKKIIVLAMALFTSIGAYCQRHAFIYSKKISKGYYQGSTIGLDKSGALILYKGKNSLKLYMEKWTVDGTRVRVGNKYVDIKSLDLGDYDYCYMQQNGESAILHICGKTDREFDVKLSPEAQKYFEANAIRDIEPQTSSNQQPEYEISPKHTSHSAHLSHSSHASHYSSY